MNSLGESIRVTHHKRGRETTSEIIVEPGRVVVFTLPTGERFEIEAWVRHQYSNGLYIRALDSSIDIEPNGDNTVRIKPRPE